MSSNFHSGNLFKYKNYAEIEIMAKNDRDKKFEKNDTIFTI